MTEKWTPMKALRKADKALEDLMVPHSRQTLVSIPH